jgi:hypothetical protein
VLLVDFCEDFGSVVEACVGAGAAAVLDVDADFDSL